MNKEMQYDYIIALEKRNRTTLILLIVFIILFAISFTINCLTVELQGEYISEVSYEIEQETNEGGNNDAYIVINDYGVVFIVLVISAITATSIILICRSKKYGTTKNNNNH